jgi:PKD repeat protein
VAPKIGGFSVSSPPMVVSGGSASLTVNASFTDPGTLDTHTASIDCGAGVTVQSDAPNGSATGTCTFASAGVYGVQLTVRDDDGDSDTRKASGQVVVVDPLAGWITAGGWINSPAGAYCAAASTAGKLAFSLSARYEGANDRPSGSVDFKLNVGKFDFHSTSLDWLVVSNGDATVEGRGTLNGGGDYRFSVTTRSGDADEIRVRVWKRSTGALVYDSRPGSESLTTLGGGSIQVHR